MSRTIPFYKKEQEVARILTSLKSPPIEKSIFPRSKKFLDSLKTNEKKQIRMTKSIIRKFITYIIILQENPTLTKDKIINIISNLLSLKNLVQNIETYGIKPTLRSYNLLKLVDEKIISDFTEYISNTNSVRNIQGVMTNLTNNIRLPEVSNYKHINEFVKGFVK